MIPLPMLGVNPRAKGSSPPPLSLCSFCVGGMGATNLKFSFSTLLNLVCSSCANCNVEWDMSWTADNTWQGTAPCCALGTISLIFQSNGIVVTTGSIAGALGTFFLANAVWDGQSPIAIPRLTQSTYCQGPGGVTDPANITVQPQ